jgi:hypothetical protein
MNNFTKIIGGFIFLIIFIIVMSIIISILRPADGRNYSKGIKHGYAKKCNFPYTRDKNLEILNPDYELGLETGYVEALKNNCNQEYYNKL